MNFLYILQIWLFMNVVYCSNELSHNENDDKSSNRDDPAHNENDDKSSNKDDKGCNGNDGNSGNGNTNNNGKN